MSCCQQSQRDRERIILRAACCKARCIASDRCPVSGVELIPLAIDPAAKCPADRWPNPRGRVTWMGVRWIGLPLPLLPVLWAMLGRIPKALPGCGCILWLKVYAARLKRWKRGVCSTMRNMLLGSQALAEGDGQHDDGPWDKQRQ